MSPRASATAHELARVTLLAGLPGEILTKLAKQMEVAARTPAKSSAEKTWRAQRTRVAALRCWIATPFGRPVEPEV